MEDGHVFIGCINIYDGDLYTRRKAATWALQLIRSYRVVYQGLKEQLDPVCPISFQISKSLVDEAVIDAIIGLRKITDSTNNKVSEPNAFKIAAYLAYWWLRHQPAYLHYPKGYKIDDAKLSDVILDDLNDEKKLEKTRLFRWKLKHINELVAVHFVSTYIFQFENVICGKPQEKRIKKKEKDEFCYVSFVEMMSEMLDKLTYYFAYRAITPKVIEHILEAYTIHPAWKYTGNLWHGDSDEEKKKESI